MKNESLTEKGMQAKRPHDPLQITKRNCGISLRGGSLEECNRLLYTENAFTALQMSRFRESD